MKVLDETGTKKLVAAYKQADSEIKTTLTNVSDVTDNITDPHGRIYPYMFGHVVSTANVYYTYPFTYNTHGSAIMFEVHSSYNNIHGYIQIRIRPTAFNSAIFISQCYLGSTYVTKEIPFCVAYNSTQSGKKTFYFIASPVSSDVLFIKPICIRSNVAFDTEGVEVTAASIDELKTKLGVDTIREITTVSTGVNTTTTTT